MDPFSITVGCIGLIDIITRTSVQVVEFMRDVQAAKSDLDAVSRELLSLKTVLELLAEDITTYTNEPFPLALWNQITGIITNCGGIVEHIQQELRKHEGGKLSKAAHWVAFGKGNMANLKLSLEAHKSALEIALDMISLFVLLSLVEGGD
jgi:hypothetical protein